MFIPVPKLVPSRRWPNVWVWVLGRTGEWEPPVEFTSASELSLWGLSCHHHNSCRIRNDQMSPESVVFLRNFSKNISKSVKFFFFFLLIYPIYLIWLLLCDLGENLPFSPEILLLVINIILLRKGHSSGVSNIHFFEWIFSFTDISFF